MNKNILKNRKAILSAALVIAATASAFAQGNGIAGINEATSMVSSYFDPGTKLIYAIGAVVGLIGGVKDTEYHERIIDLVNKNANLIRERMKAA